MNGGERFFVDTNVLLYSVDPSDPSKRAAAKSWMSALWQRGAGSLSWQVLNEFYVNATRKMRSPSAKARNIVQALALWAPVDTTIGLIERAWYWSDQAQVPYWDALIIAAAERAGCGRLLSEDFQVGRTFGPVQVVSPFQSSPEDFGLV